MMMGNGNMAQQNTTATTTQQVSSSQNTNTAQQTAPATTAQNVGNNQNNSLSMSANEAYKIAADAYNAKDYDTALKYYQYAAEKNDSQAQFSLGAMYAMGNGVTQNYAEAMKWYLKAANQGYASAQNNIGVMYMNGEYVKQDFTKAREYFSKAIKLGSPLAENNLLHLDTKLLVKKLNNYHLLDEKSKIAIEHELVNTFTGGENKYRQLIWVLREYVYLALERDKEEPLESDEIKLIVEMSGLICAAMLNKNMVEDAKKLISTLIPLNQRFQGNIKAKTNNHARLFWRLANVNYILHEYDEALKHNDTALTLAMCSLKTFKESNQFDMLLNIYSLFVQTYNALQDYDEAIKRGLECLNLYEELPLSVQEAYRTQNALFTLTLSDTYILMRDFDNAIKIVEPIIKEFKDKEKTDLILDILSQTYYHIGAASFEKEDYETALKSFADAIKDALDISDPSASALRACKYLLCYARVFFRVDAYDEAIGVYSKILDILSNNDFYGKMEVFFECLDFSSRSYLRLNKDKEAKNIINHFFNSLKNGDFDENNYSYSAASMAYTMSTICETEKDYETQEKWLLLGLDYLMDITDKNGDYYLLYNVINSDLEKFRNKR